MSKRQKKLHHVDDNLFLDDVELRYSSRLYTRLDSFGIRGNFCDMQTHHPGIVKLRTIDYYHPLQDDPELNQPEGRSPFKKKKHRGKRRKCWLAAFSPFPTMLSTLLQEYCHFCRNSFVVCKCFEFGRDRDFVYKMKRNGKGKGDNAEK